MIDGVSLFLLGALWLTRGFIRGLAFGLILIGFVLALLIMFAAFGYLHLYYLFYGWKLPALYVLAGLNLAIVISAVMRLKWWSGS